MPTTIHSQPDTIDLNVFYAQYPSRFGIWIYDDKPHTANLSLLTLNQFSVLFTFAIVMTKLHTSLKLQSLLPKFRVFVKNSIHTLSLQLIKHIAPMNKTYPPLPPIMLVKTLTDNSNK